jgi:rhodanese-related sulfurtransferase
VVVKLSKLMRWLPFGKVPEIDPQALHASMSGSNPPGILDVRSSGEWEKSRITGAVNVPITELASRLGELPFDRNKPLVTICLSAHRSIPAVRLLREAGYKDVRQLRGGMLNWWKAKLPADKQRRRA